ncbi:alpha/beta hydrolase [Streptomyces sp. NP160]|uniref:alpha/beta hydrolase n=1 Tax=Streptomyces sp. NP160 TaxID=2586637 RepID=UPI00111B33B1|nr:alpha/beta hydrolase [Streptomyces sp. NP160]TNM69414.1 alpha/beta hydrolase [Streptomyces sp. NP160]
MTGGPAAQRPHLFRDGPGPVLLTLHGTGGDEAQIAELAPMVDPDAAVLSPRGDVVEQGVRRWFRRYAEGIFDEDSVVAEAARLADFITWARTAHSLEGRRIVAVGLSNGANIALATLLLHPGVLQEVIALSGMHPLPDRQVGHGLEGTRVLLLNGASDPMAPSGSVDRLERTLRDAGAAVDRRVRPGGHGAQRSEVAAAAEWVARPTSG